MEKQTTDGYLVVGDISGFTSYLATTELEHAQEILAELLDLIVQKLGTMLTLSKLEGDAVFVYAPAEAVTPGETLLELIESVYVSFRQRRDAMTRATTCECRACSAIGTLDLKFVTHFGEYIVQRVAGRDELLGSAVNLVHRLLKNSVRDATGWNAYASFTEACLQNLRVAPGAMAKTVETYEHLGNIAVWSVDLDALHRKLSETPVVIENGDADRTLVRDFRAVAPPRLWEWLTTPERREQWMGKIRITPLDRPGGRTTRGARNHCAHGKNGVIVEEVLDFKPFDYYTSRWTSAKPPMAFITTSRLESHASGTRLRMFVKVEPPFRGWAGRAMAKMIAWMLARDFAKSQGVLATILS